jgi:predicted CxxxxCH...CXXCH cytochrome family protein
MVGFLAAALCGCAEHKGRAVGDGPVKDATTLKDIAVGEGVKTSDGPRDSSMVGDVVLYNCATGCHGSKANAAPPTSVKGQSATTARAVGAHQVHVKLSSWHAPFACDDCHKVPKESTDPGHIDTALPAEVTFSVKAKLKGATPAWNGTTCSSTYCHGGTLSGGKVTAPAWAQVNGLQVQCDSCHGTPPPQKHNASDTQCNTCHAAVVDKNRKIIAPKLHIDGKVNATGGHATGYKDPKVHGPDFYKDPKSCGACHGTDLKGGSAAGCDSCHKQSNWLTSCVYCHGGTNNQTGAPPADVAGKTAISAPGVGRHTSHVTLGASHNPYNCAVCHGKTYKSALDPGHLGLAPADMAFTGLAKGTTYNATTRQCANIYCHGNGKAGSGGSALWTGTLTGGCSACHDDESDGSGMTLSGEHKKHLVDKQLKCVDCHQCVVNGTKQITNMVKHINGKPDVCDPTWNPATKSCSSPGNKCHQGQSESW